VDFFHTLSGKFIGAVNLVNNDAKFIVERVLGGGGGDGDGTEEEEVELARCLTQCPEAALVD
jgi:hypothetical protein